MKRGIGRVFTLVMGIVLSIQVYGAGHLPFTNSYIQKIDKTFLTEGQLDQEKFETYRSYIKTKRDQVYKLSYEERIHKKGQSKKKAQKKALNDVANYDLLLEFLKSAREQKGDDLYLFLDQVKTIDEALKVEGNKLGYQEALEGVRGLIKKYAISKKNPKESEAINKVDSKNSAFIFHRDNISEVDVLDSYLGGKNPLYKGMNVWWPSSNTFRLKKIRKTQSKPKMDVYFTNPATGEDEVFKIKVGKEIHSEPTVGALANTLGIYADLSKNIRDIKLYIGEMSFIEFSNDWNSYFDEFDLDKLIKEKGQDENGNYIVFYDGLIEQKFKAEKTYHRLGPWGWNAENHKPLREVRGLLMFAVWISNTDLKESENNKLIMRDTENGPRFFKVIHDMGLSLGNILGEKPVNLKWNPIKRITDNEIVLNFLNIQDNPALKNVTVADARWMIRKIAKLTRKQIRDAVSIGGWPTKEPYNIEALLTEKLISRRNTLVRAFGLEKEFAPMEFKKIPLKKLPSKIEDYTVDFSHELVDLTRGPLKKIPHVVVDLMRAGVGAISKIELDPIEIGLDDGYISQILFKLNRKVIRNPNPRHENETYIIQDHFLYGVRFGYGVILSGDVAKYREYNLIHTARTQNEAKYKGNFFLNLGLPVQVFLNKLPKNHILTVSDYLETRGRVKLEASSGISIGTEGSVSRLHLGRSIISRQKDELTFYEDNSNFNQIAWRVFIKAGLLKVPFGSVDRQFGKIDRNIYHLDVKDLLKNDSIEAARRVLEELDHRGIKKLARPTKVSSKFIENNFKLNLLGLIGRSSFQRSDDIETEGRYFFQLEKSNEVFWNTFLSKESSSESSQILYETTEDDRIIDGALKLEYLHYDQRVTSKELEKVYLPFLNAASKEKMIEFSPFAHSSNQEWGKMNIRLRMDIYKSGLDKIKEVKLSQLLKSSTAITGKSYKSTVNQYKSMTSMRNDQLDKSKRFKFRGKSYSYVKFYNDIKTFAKEMAKARKHKDSKTKMAKLTLESFYKSVRLRDGSYSPLVLQLTTSLLKKSDYFLEASFYPDGNSENKLPERVIPFNIEGKKREVKAFSFLTNLEDTLNIYEHFIVN